MNRKSCSHIPTLFVGVVLVLGGLATDCIVSLSVRCLDCQLYLVYSAACVVQTRLFILQFSRQLKINRWNTFTCNALPSTSVCLRPMLNRAFASLHCRYCSVALHLGSAAMVCCSRFSNLENTDKDFTGWTLNTIFYFCGKGKSIKHFL